MNKPYLLAYADESEWAPIVKLCVESRVEVKIKPARYKDRWIITVFCDSDNAFFTIKWHVEKTLGLVEV